MNNCFISKIKDNINLVLPKEGYFNIPVKGNEEILVYVANDNESTSILCTNCQVRLSSESEWHDNIALAPNTKALLYFKGNNGIGHIQKYKVYTITFPSIEDCCYSSYVTQLNGPSELNDMVKGDISKLEGLPNLSFINISSNNLIVNDFSWLNKFPNVFRITLVGNKVRGNIDELPSRDYIVVSFNSTGHNGKPSGHLQSLAIPSIEVIGVAASNIVGDISVLSICTKLKTLYAYTNPNITGSCNALADAMYNNGEGRVSGTLNIDGNSNMTYNGDPLTKHLKIDFTPSGPSYTYG